MCILPELRRESERSGRMSEVTAIRGSLERLRKWIRATREEGLGPMGTDLETLKDIADVLEADISELEDDLNTAELDNEHLREQLNEFDGDCFCGATAVQWRNHSVRLQERLDEVERTHMRLPMDADGVPIRVGDYLQGVYSEFEVCAVSEHYAYWAEGRHFDKADCCRHVQQDALESLLCDMIHEYGSTDALTETIAEKYAERIRKAVEHE